MTEDTNNINDINDIVEKISNLNQIKLEVYLEVYLVDKK